MNEPATPASSQVTISEDWQSVWLGTGIILLSLIGFRINTPVFSWNNGVELQEQVLSLDNLSIIVVHFLFLLAVAGLSHVISRKPFLHFLATFTIVYLVTIVALVLGGNGVSKDLNLEPVIFSLLLGLLIGNLFKLPGWLRTSLSAELFVKIGLVLLGTTIIFRDLLKAGTLGLVQALVVVVTVWYFAYWLAKKFKLEEDLTMMLASAVSICGISAAIATAGAIKGDPKKLSYVISLVLVTAVPMMIFMPPIAEYLGLSQEVTGAWLGGTIDTTGAVVAAGTLAGEAALKTSTIVKFSQNVLLGLAAFSISIYWTYANNTGQEKPSLKIIWERFPKFVIGFLGASLLFSMVIDVAVINEVKDGLKSAQTAFFALAFTSIGLETKFTDLFNNKSKSPLYVFLIAQSFNILITLVIAYFLFR